MGGNLVGNDMRNGTRVEEDGDRLREHTAKVVSGPSFVSVKVVSHHPSVHPGAWEKGRQTGAGGWDRAERGRD